MDAQTKVRMVTNAGIDVLEILNREILRELLSEGGHQLSEDELSQLMKDAKDNPWDAAIIYQLEVLAKEMFSE